MFVLRVRRGKDWAVLVVVSGGGLVGETAAVCAVVVASDGRRSVCEVAVGFSACCWDLRSGIRGIVSLYVEGLMEVRVCGVADCIRVEAGEVVRSVCLFGERLKLVPLALGAAECE